MESVATDNVRLAVILFPLLKPSAAEWKTLHFYLDSSQGMITVLL